MQTKNFCKIYKSVSSQKDEKKATTTVNYPVSKHFERKLQKYADQPNSDFRLFEKESQLL
jgi:hypothetical protein